MKRRRRERGEPRLFRSLSRSPERPWPEGALHHGARIALLVLLSLIITTLFPAADRRAVARYQVGMVADQDIIAEIPFSIPKTPEELARDRAEAEAAVPPTFLHRPEARDSMAARLDRFFERVQEEGRTGGRLAVEEVVLGEGIPASPGQVDQLQDPQVLRSLRRAAERVARELVPLVLDATDAQLITTDRIIVRDDTGAERSIPSDSLLWGREFLNRALAILDPASPEVEALFRLIVIRFFESSFVVEVVATELGRGQARQAVPTTKGNVVAGEAIARRGDRIGEGELERLNAYERALRERGLLTEAGADWVSFLGMALLNLLFLGIFGLLLYFFRREVYRNFRWVLLHALLVLAYFLMAAGIARQGFPPMLLPIAFPVLPVAVLWDGRMALIQALVLSAMTGAQAPFSEYSVLALTLVGGAAAALSARAIRRRAQTWVFIALITLAYGLGILAFGLVARTAPEALLFALLLAAANATVSAILAMGFMPVFEWFTGITTDQTLLEWADPNRPLLKRLAMEAPGTYAHTINVANLAEAAATAIGANGLLCRVGVYYHDVGKMLKPQFFVENQPGNRNPHDKLKPHTSAAIVREHVLEGERMAREAGVPPAVARFIPEHHGTQLIGFFYDKAREEAEEEPDPAGFRYPGPRPRSRETAIAMLADSVESTTRALQDPSPERIRELIRSLVEGKIRDGQLEEAPLTLREIALIQEQFAKVLGGMYHHRLDYPATKHLTEAPANRPHTSS